MDAACLATAVKKCPRRKNRHIYLFAWSE